MWSELIKLGRRIQIAQVYRTPFTWHSIWLYHTFVLRLRHEVCGILSDPTNHGLVKQLCPEFNKSLRLRSLDGFQTQDLEIVWYKSLPKLYYVCVCVTNFFMHVSLYDSARSEVWYGVAALPTQWMRVVGGWARWLAGLQGRQGSQTRWRHSRAMWMRVVGWSSLGDGGPANVGDRVAKHGRQGQQGGQAKQCKIWTENITLTPKYNMWLIKFKEFNPILIKTNHEIWSDLL